MSKKMMMITIIIIVIFLCGLAAVFLLQPYSGPRRPEEQAALSTITKQFGGSEDWHSARFAIYCKVFQSGRTVPQVESDLSRIGAWRVYGDNISREYKLDGISVGNQLFDVLADLDSIGNISKIYVVEKIGESDRQVIVCTDDDYFFKSELNQKLNK